jgi:NAD-dependent dihydropyrimidine dehydrogenase PreA subunit
MAYVITLTCLGEQYAACVSVCPVDCIKPGDYQGQPFMIIQPDVCTDCGLCLPKCPIGAIVEDPDVNPAAGELNIQLSGSFAGNPSVAERPRNDPPRIAGHTIVNP